MRAVIKFGDRTSTLTIPCGDGKRTVRWLGVVAAQRFVLDGAAKGKVRSRERGHTMGKAQILPRNVSTSSEAFAHPDALVKDIVQDGDEVFVELDSKVVMDEAMRPIRSNWQVVAFQRNNEDGRRRALADEFSKREQKKNEALMREQTARGLVEDAKGDKMRNLIHPQLLQTQHLGLAVEQQWGEMDRNGLMARWIRQGKDQERVKRCLAKHYLQLCELFKFYGASVGMADQHLVEFVEFSAFARDAGVYGGARSPIDHALLTECFAEACEIPVTNVVEAHMALPQFLSAVIWLAEVVKHSGHTGGGMREELQALTETANRQRSLAMRRAVGGAGVGEKLERFLHEEIDSCVHKRATQLIGLVAKQHLGEQRVLARFWDRHPELRAIYATYAAEPENWDPRDCTTHRLSFANFQLLVEDSGLLESSGPKDELTRREVRRAFAGARTEVDHESDHPLQPKKAPQPPKKKGPSSMDDRGSMGSRGSKKSRGSLTKASSGRRSRDEPPVDDSEMLSYAEFCEAVLRLAMLKWEDEKHAVDDSVSKVRDAIAQICQRCTNAASPTKRGRK